MAVQTLIIHGRQPALGRAELESLYGPEKLRAIDEIATLIDVEPTEVDFIRLGGMVKFCKLLTILDTTNWTEIESFLTRETPQHFKYLDEGKLRIGLSTYGLKTSPGRLHASALKLKKAGKSVGRSIRIVPNEQLALNSASVLYNKLTQKLGWELIFVRDGNKTIVAQTIAAQDINKYAARDQKRPMRDTKVGMLPPKLAQIIINLAVGGLDDFNKPVCLPDGQIQPRDLTILDPFCGTGVVLQEAVLMGFRTSGSDLEPRMVDYSNANLKWLESEYLNMHIRYEVGQGDATSHNWQSALKSGAAIASETYLGRPLSRLPDQKTLKKIIQDCDTINKKFLANVARQVEPGFRMCVAVPAWSKNKSKTVRADAGQGATEKRTKPYIQYGEGASQGATQSSTASSSRVDSSAGKQSRAADQFWHLPMLDYLEKLGYNRVKFRFSSNKDLIYHRPDQIVARELVVLERK